VSRSYYEIVSRLSDDILKMFSYSGIKHDKHVREHEVYVIRTSDDVESSAELAARKHVDAQPETKASRPNKIMIAVGLALLAVIAVVAVTMERKNSPPAPSQIQPASPPPKAEQEPPAPSAKPGVKAVADTPKNIKKTKPAENRAPADRNPPAIEHQAKDEKKTGQNKFKGNMKQDANKFTCTDAQRSMNQCKDY
jgi:hypothetical protein